VSSLSKSVTAATGSGTGHGSGRRRAQSGSTQTCTCTASNTDVLETCTADRLMQRNLARTYMTMYSFAQTGHSTSVQPGSAFNAMSLMTVDATLTGPVLVDGNAGCPNLQERLASNSAGTHSLAASLANVAGSTAVTCEQYGSSTTHHFSDPPRQQATGCMADYGILPCTGVCVSKTPSNEASMAVPECWDANGGDATAISLFERYDPTGGCYALPKDSKGYMPLMYEPRRRRGLLQSQYVPRAQDAGPHARSGDFVDFMPKTLYNQAQTSKTIFPVDHFLDSAQPLDGAMEIAKAFLELGNQLLPFNAKNYGPGSCQPPIPREGC